MKWHVTAKGYLATYTWDPDTKQKGTIYQHRLVWEIYRGPIPKGGVIHHKNGIKSDNRIKNLQLMSSTGLHNVHHQNEARALGVVKNCPFCHQKFVAFGSKKYCSDRCRNSGGQRQWREKNRARYNATMRRFRAKKKAQQQAA